MSEDSPGFERNSPDDMAPFEKAFSAAAVPEACPQQENDEMYLTKAIDKRHPDIHRAMIVRAALIKFLASNDRGQSSAAIDMQQATTTTPLERQEFDSTTPLDDQALNNEVLDAVFADALHKAHQVAKDEQHHKRLRVLGWAAVVGGIVIIGTMFYGAFQNADVRDDGQSSAEASPFNRSDRETAALVAMSSAGGLSDLHLCAAELRAQAEIRTFEEAHPGARPGMRANELPSVDTLADASDIAQAYNVPCLTPAGGESVFVVDIKGAPIVITPHDIAPDVDADSICNGIYAASTPMSPDLAVLIAAERKAVKDGLSASGEHC